MVAGEIAKPHSLDKEKESHEGVPIASAGGNSNGVSK